MSEDVQLDGDRDAAIDHATVARIIRRALEIAGPVQVDGAHGGVSHSALVAAADEVGIPAAAVMRSLAVEKLGPERTPLLGDRVLGPALLIVDDEIAGSAPQILERIDGWLVDGHHMRRLRLRNGRGEWGKRTGVVGVTVRRLRKATGEGRLGDLRKVTAVAEDVGTGSAVVRITVDRSAGRRTAATGGAVALVGGAGGIVIAVAVAPLALVVTPLAVAGGVGVVIRSRHRADEAVSEVERLLEAVADGQQPSRLRSEVANRVIGRRPGRVRRDHS